MNKAGRAYAIEFGSAMLAYMVVLVVSILLIQRDPQSLWRYPLAVAPVVPAIFALVAFVRFLGRIDELQRRIHLEGIGLSFVATAILTFAYGFLEGVGFPRLSYIWVLPLMVALWGIGAAIASRRYR
jgi:ABC-type cobalamin transport system permease subunit